MSTTQHAASPRAPRQHHAHPKSATQTTPNANGNRNQRRSRGNRAHNATYPPQTSQEPYLAESAVFSSEELTASHGTRQSKKHTRSQPSADRVFSPNSIAAALTDSELIPTHSTATPIKLQGAYAGPTFHASPAASALPVPKFLSKSVPANVRPGPPTPPPDETSDSTSSPSPSPSRTTNPTPARHQDSPLDLLFKADRAERARNITFSPPFPSASPQHAAAGTTRPPYIKHESSNSLNAPFPIELDASSKPAHPSPPPASPGAHRSVTAPSNIPQVQTAGQVGDANGAIQDLLNRLSLSQTKPAMSTPPRAAQNIIPDHTPSPFYDGRSPMRSTSGPTTPAQSAPDSEYFYGNRNLSPLFKASQVDSPKRNSGLRTEITAESPVMPQGDFPQVPLKMNNDTRNPIGNMMNNHDGSRRGSAPHVPHMPPYRGHQGNVHMHSPGRRPRPDSYPYGNAGGNLNSPKAGPASTPQKATSAMAFVPSSVRAKPQATTPKKTEADSLTLEQNLKRLLNMPASGAQ